MFKRAAETNSQSIEKVRDEILKFSSKNKMVFLK